MADFLDAFKRRESESSEGSYGDEDEDNEPQFAREELHHHSDEEQDNRNDRPNAGGANQKSSHYEENKEGGHGHNKKGPSPQKNQNKKKDHYLYEGEEKPYESDQEEQAQGQQKSGKKDLKGEKKDPTFVPKGAFYQHDTRGDDVEYVPKKGGDKLNKYKWKHDKFEKGPKKPREAENDRNYYDKNTQVMYVPKGQKAEEGEQRAEPAQQREPKRQPQKQYYEKKDYRDRNQGYNNQKEYTVYQKKDKKPAGENTGAGRNRDYVVEYVAKKKETQ